MHDVKKPMACIDCHMRIDATIPQAKRHGCTPYSQRCTALS